MPKLGSSVTPKVPADNGTFVDMRFADSGGRDHRDPVDGSLAS